MFRKRKDTAAEGADAGRPDDAVAQRPWYGPTRALTTLAGAAGAVLLIWLATQFGDDSKAEYWSALGLVAAAGLVMAFSQILGGWTKFGLPRISGNVFLLAFVPTLVVCGWILVAHQPESGFFRNDVRGWSDDLGLLNVVTDFANFLPALAFLTGLTFGLTFDTTGPRRRVVRHDREVHGPVSVPAATAPRAADEPVTAERHVTAADADGPDAWPDRDREHATVHSRGTPAAPRPEPPPRRSDDLE